MWGLHVHRQDVTLLHQMIHLLPLRDLLPSIASVDDLIADMEDGPLRHLGPPAGLIESALWAKGHDAAPLGRLIWSPLEGRRYHQFGPCLLRIRLVRIWLNEDDVVERLITHRLSAEEPLALDIGEVGAEKDSICGCPPVGFNPSTCVQEIIRQPCGSRPSTQSSMACGRLMKEGGGGREVAYQAWVSLAHTASEIKLTPLAKIAKSL